MSGSLARAALLIPLLSTGCVYKLGTNLAAGFLDEADGGGKTDGVTGVLTDVERHDVIGRLGEQLGEALKSDVRELTPEMRAAIEESVDGAITVLTQKMARGMRDDVSPEVRTMVQQDIVHTLSEGLKGELGHSAQETVDAIVTRAVAALVREIADDDTKIAIASTLRDSMYMAMREGRPGSPAVSEVLETTLTENMLDPLERSVGGLTETVADRVDASAQRTERTLKGVISALVVILGVFVLMYLLTRRQLNRQRDQAAEATLELRTMGAALDLLDQDTRTRILGKVDEYHAATGKAAREAPKAPDRSDDYLR